jgi:hypothetical protein
MKYQRNAAEFVSTKNGRHDLTVEGRQSGKQIQVCWQKHSGDH